MVFEKNRIPWNKGKREIYSEETRKKMSEAHTGKRQSEESIRKRVLHLKGVPRSEEIKRKISIANTGKKRSAEIRIKLSEIRKGKKHSKESIQKRKETWNKLWSNLEFKTKYSQNMKNALVRSEVKKKMIESHKGHKPWCTGKTLTEEHRKKLSLARKKGIAEGRIKSWNKGKSGLQTSWMKGKHHTAESNEKNRLSHLGKKAWNKGIKTGLIPWNKGKVGILQHTEEARMKIREKRSTQVFPLKDSLPEVKIQNFLRQMNIEFKSHKLIVEIRHKYQCDLFVPSLNLIIEIDGDYWHGNINNPRFKLLNKKQVYTKEKDTIRTKELLEKGYKVLRLWESEVEKMSLEDFKEKINNLT